MALEAFKDNPRLESVRLALSNNPAIFVGTSHEMWNSHYSTGDGMPFGFPSQAQEKEYSISLAPRRTKITPEELDSFCDGTLMQYFAELSLCKQRSKKAYYQTFEWDKTQDYLVSPELTFYDKLADIVIKPAIVANNPEAIALRPRFSPDVPEHTYPVVDILVVRVFPDAELLEYMNRDKRSDDEIPNQFPWITNPKDLSPLFRWGGVSRQLRTDLKNRPTS